MSRKVYYNEFDSRAAAWLRELIKQGAIPHGDVDERSVTDLKPQDLKGYTQCHFFAGIGVWAYALENAGWGDTPIWTGSCPCQPFSAAGKRKGVNDERHLWPTFYRLIAKCRPDVIFGEQVAGKDGLAWLDGVSIDLERAGYAVGAAITTAAGFGAPHRRERLYFSGLGNASKGRQIQHSTSERRRPIGKSGPYGQASVADTTGTGLEGSTGARLRGRSGRSTRNDSSSKRNKRPIAEQQRTVWTDCDWLPFIDGKTRPVEPGTFPMVDGTPARVGRLCGYGNALCAPQAQGFVEAFMEVMRDGTI